MSEKIPKGWKRVKFTDVAEIIGGGTPSKKRPEYWEGDVDWLTVNDFNNGLKYVRYAKEKITKLGLERSSTKILKKGEIIISARGTVGATAMLAKDMAFNQSNYGITSKTDATFNNFLYYLLKYNISSLKQASYGAVFDTITKSTFENLEILLPPLPEQKAIASVLSSLDDKIDLLHRQNQTLEQKAETLFRKWFIEEADEDWEEKPLDRIANFLNGLACQKYPPKNNIDKLPVLKIKELKNGFTENSDWAISDVPSEYIVVNGDVIFSWSGSLIVKIWNGEKCVLNQHLFKVTSNKYPKWFYYFWIKYHLQKFITIAESKATTMGHIKREDLSKALVLVPPDKELLKMDQKIFPFIDKIISINNQIRTLENLRDTLLPKLMSGECKITHDFVVETPNLGVSTGKNKIG